MLNRHIGGTRSDGEALGWSPSGHRLRGTAGNPTPCGGQPVAYRARSGTDLARSDTSQQQLSESSNPTRRTTSPTVTSCEQQAVAPEGAFSTPHLLTSEKG